MACESGTSTAVDHRTRARTRDFLYHRCFIVGGPVPRAVGGQPPLRTKSPSVVPLLWIW